MEEQNTAQKLKIPKISFPEDIFTFYLSHPFASREYIRKWELDFERKNPNIALMNPFYDVEGEGREDVKARDEGREFEKDAGYNWRLCARDKIAIEFSRGIVGVVDSNSDVSIGTNMEFVYARCSASNPKLLVCTNEKLRDHPWLRTHFHEVYFSLEEFEDDAPYQVQRVRDKWGF
jgi:hypothetical protein